MRHFSRILFLLTVTLSSVVVSHAQTTIVKDTLAPGNPADHGALQHLAQFSTTLSASVDKDPTPRAETTLKGPVFLWSGGNGVVKPTSTTGQTNGLQSSSGTELKPYGQNSITVYCTATYGEYNSNNNKFIKTVSAKRGSIVVKFWSTTPVSLKSLASNPDLAVHGSNVAELYIDKGYPSRYEYQQYAEYSFAVLDNQPTAHYYSYGEVHETLNPIKWNRDYQDAIQKQGAPGPEATKPNPGGVFTDGNGWTTGDFKRPNRWPQTLVNETTAAGRDDFWYSITQDWEYVEYPIGSSVAQRTPLKNSHFTISFYRGYVERH